MHSMLLVFSGYRNELSAHSGRRPELPVLDVSIPFLLILDILYCATRQKKAVARAAKRKAEESGLSMPLKKKVARR